MRPYSTHRCHYPSGHRAGPQAVLATEHHARLARTRPREIIGVGLACSVWLCVLPIGLGELGVGPGVNVAVSVATLLVGAALQHWPLDAASQHARAQLAAQRPRAAWSGSEPSGAGVAYAASEWAHGGDAGG